MVEPQKPSLGRNGYGLMNYIFKPCENLNNIVKERYDLPDENSIMKSSDNKANTNIKGLTVEHVENYLLNQNEFASETNYLNSLKIFHKTSLLDIAQDSLGTIEVTLSEYKRLSPEQKQKTNIQIIGNHGDSTDAWCAHTVSYLLDKAHIKFGGHKKAVSQFITWARNNKIYRPIGLNNITKENYKSGRKARTSMIQKQLPKMNEGDLIVWKAKYVAEVNDGQTLLEASKSHIGIIESVDLQHGIVTVIEGNANIDIKDAHDERKLVAKPFEGKNGAQKVGEFQEVNPRDGIIRKQYTIEDLASYGYSGYIDMRSLVH